MTKNEIIELADKADAEADKVLNMKGEFHPNWHEVRDEIFATLVAEKEREQLTDAAMKAAEKAVDLAIALEREACAKEADKRLYDFTMLTSNPPQNGSAWSIASAIRARGQA